MNEIQGNDQSLIASLGLSAIKPEKKDSLGQEDFLELLITQLKNQNPLEPKDGTEFLGQMAQFASLDSIQSMESSLSNMAGSLQSSQALQASTLVGRQVTVASSYGLLNENGNMEGIVELPHSVGDLKVSIYNSSGEIVKSMNLENQSEGEIKFLWGGIDDNGDGVPPGMYQVQASANVKGEDINFKTYLSTNVDSVTVGQGADGIVLNLAGFGQASLSDIKELK